MIILFSFVFLTSSPIYLLMATKELAKELLASIESELTLWASECNQIDNGYDYESQFIERMRKIGQILLEQSTAIKGAKRDKKKSTPALEKY